MLGLRVVDRSSDGDSGVRGFAVVDDSPESVETYHAWVLRDESASFGFRLHGMDLGDPGLSGEEWIEEVVVRGREADLELGIESSSLFCELLADVGVPEAAREVEIENGFLALSLAEMASRLKRS